MWLGGLGGGRESWDRLVVEYPAVVVGVTDTSSEDSDIVDSSRLTPAIVCYVLRTKLGGVERAERCSDRENMFLE